MNRHPSLAVLFLVLFSAAAGAAEPPAPGLRPGLWRIERTFEAAPGGKAAEPMKSELCFEPAKAFAEQFEMFGQLGCAVESRRLAADTWEVNVRCAGGRLPNGSSTGRMVVASPEAYTSSIESDGEFASLGARERVVAKRIGDCR